MFKKLHRQMTIFSTLITSGILILMAVASLAIFERGLVRNSYERFLNNGNSCVAYLENQTILSHKWILEAKLEYGVEFRILNNGKMLRPLEENRKKQTQFIASASHELRSPLAVILSCVQAMEKGTGETGRLLQTIKSEGNRMSRLIGDMLSLANADNKSWSVMKTDFQFDNMLLETYEKNEPILREKKISLKVVLPEEPLSICKCDSARLSQVLRILLDNGASYVPAGGRMELGVEEKEKYFRIYVQDNGPGIPDENKEAVFQRLYREDSARKDKQHFGLGLCIAKEIVTLHKGSIRITDTPGGGSTFVIKLPKEK